MLGVHWQFLHCRLDHLFSRTFCWLMPAVVAAALLPISRHRWVALMCATASAVAAGFAMHRARRNPGSSLTRHLVAIAMMSLAASLTVSLPQYLHQGIVIYAAMVALALYRAPSVVGTYSAVGVVFAGLAFSLLGWTEALTLALGTLSLGSVLFCKCVFERNALHHLAEQWGQRIDFSNATAEVPVEPVAPCPTSLDSELVAVIPEAVVIMDLQGAVSSWNLPAKSIFGWSAEEMVGNSLTDSIIPLQFHIQYRQALAQAFEARPGGPTAASALPRRLDMTVCRRDGAEISVELCLVPMQSTPMRVAAFFQDVTARKLAEKAQWEQHHLANAVAAMDQFLGVLGHELRTPIAGLRAMVEILQDPTLHDAKEIPTYLESLHAELLRMADTLNNLLESAKTYDPARHWNWSSFDIAAVCAEAMETIRPLMDAGAVRLSYTSTAPDLKMRGDADAVRRLLLNLLSNAQKNTSAGSIEIAVSTFKRIGHDWIELNVHDTGVGIAPDVALRLGQAFALNAGGIDSESVRGSGLGLAICRSIVAAHQGTITFQSDPGKGTTFTVRVRADLKGPCNSPAQAITQEIAA